MIASFFSKYGSVFADSPVGLDADSIFIEEDIRPALRDFVTRLNPASLLVVGDVHTWKVAGDYVTECLSHTGIPTETYVFPETEDLLIPDERAVEKLVRLGSSSRLFVAVGSGTVNDLVRYAAHVTKSAFISIPTAPSMDGYASSVCPLVIKGVKETVPAVPPTAIFIQPSIVDTAPLRMISAGIGDLVGKYSALLDWQLAALYTGEALNKPILSMVEENRDAFFETYRTDFFSTAACSSLIWNLIITGLAITANGSSRPASGSEHHISHLLEMQALQGRARHFLHGETVGLGSWIILNLYRFLLNMSLQEIEEFRSDPSKNREEQLQASFGSLADSFIRDWRNNASEREKIGSSIRSRPELWDDFRRRQRSSTGLSPEMSEIFSRARLGTSLSDFAYTREQITNVIIGAKEIRPRFTILEFLDSLGCLENVAAHIAATLF